MQATLERLRQRRDERGDEGGFTLIELLIVIVILAILAAIVIFAVQNLTGSSAKASCESDVATVDHAVEAYLAQVGKEPGAIADLMTTTTGVDSNTVGPWLHSTPTNGTHYAITVGANGAITVTAPTTGTPVVYAAGKDASPSVSAATACAGAS